MQKFLKIAAMMTMILQMETGYAAEIQDPNLTEARDMTQKFQKALKSELQSAMKSGGPLKAVSVCHKRAPEIAATLSQETGWHISRTSLKARNEANKPNAETRKILESLEQEKTQGKAVAEMEWLDVQPEQVTYIKAIPTGAVCTTCHGVKINPKLKEHIQSFYPDDMATGFAVGDIRGAFLLTKKSGE